MTAFNNNINTDYYALWYYTITGERGANAISLDQNALWGLHTNAVNDKKCMYHQYKKSIFKIDVKQIQCYKYNSPPHGYRRPQDCAARYGGCQGYDRPDDATSSGRRDHRWRRACSRSPDQWSCPCRNHPQPDWPKRPRR